MVKYVHQDCGHPAPCGCEHADSCCERCPFEDCVLDRAVARRIDQRREGRQAQVLRRGGRSVREIARLLGMSRRTAERRLHEV